MPKEITHASKRELALTGIEQAVEQAGLGKQTLVRCIGTNGRSIWRGETDIDIAGIKVKIRTTADETVLGGYGAWIYALDGCRYIWFTAFDTLNWNLPADALAKIKLALARRLYGKDEP